MKWKSILVAVIVSICAIPMVEAGVTIIHDNVLTPVYTANTITIGEIDYQAFDNDQYVPADLQFVQAWDALYFSTSGSTALITNEFDLWKSDTSIPFMFDVSGYNTITSATLEIGLAGARSDYRDDLIAIDSIYNVYSFMDLAWTAPVGEVSLIKRSLDYVTVTLDLSNVLGVNHLPDLADGKLNIMIHDDTAVDYATLRLTTVIPAPSAILLGSIGIACVGLLRKRRKM